MTKFLTILALAVVLIVGLNIAHTLIESGQHIQQATNSISVQGLSKH